jgi:hypothetical protein
VTGRSLLRCKFARRFSFRGHFRWRCLRRAGIIPARLIPLASGPVQTASAAFCNPT